MDITRTVEPKSDQLNYDDVAAHDLTVTITEVKAGPPDQPVELHNAEYPGRPYKPGKSMRRILIAAWGTEASAYVGRRITLYGDPTIRFGKDAVGGIRIRALSHITEPLTVALTVTRGKRAPFTVQPLAAAVSWTCPECGVTTSYIPDDPKWESRKAAHLAKHKNEVKP